MTVSMSTPEFTSAEEFLAYARETDPERYAEVAMRYPISSWRSDLNHKYGTIYRPTESRGVELTEEIRSRLIEQRPAREQYLREWNEDRRYASRLAREGMG